MTKGSKAILAVILAISLGGCQSMFGGGSYTARSTAVDPANVDLSGYFAERLEAGKLHLRSNRPTQAITAFRQASYDPAYSGDAYNGMGVAYAQIGRADLAKRYFGMAVAAAPADERFVRNLARLESQGAASEIQLAAQDQQREPVVAAEDKQAAAPAQQAAAPVPLLRVSDREVQIHAGGTPARPEVRVTRGRSVASQSDLPATRATDGSQYPVRIALADTSATPARYPIRIELPKAK